MRGEPNITFSNLQKTNDKIIIGIDEAGRGPVLGYMVYGMFVCKVDRVPKNLKDSKLLTDKSRRTILQQMDEQGLMYAYKALHPSFITSQMMSNVNLNNISWNAILELLNMANDHFSHIDKVYIDAVGNCEALNLFLSSTLNLNFCIEPKADSKYLVVSGASIVAKVTRDETLKRFGSTIGSGYPSDPKTKQWLSNNMNKIFGWGCAVRYTWGTAKNMLGCNKSLQYFGKLRGFYVHSK